MNNLIENFKVICKLQGYQGNTKLDDYIYFYLTHILKYEYSYYKVCDFLYTDIFIKFPITIVRMNSAGHYKAKYKIETNKEYITTELVDLVDKDIIEKICSTEIQ